MFFALLYSGFMSSNNTLAIALNVSSVAIAGIGAACLLITGNVDLSIGGQYALISVLMAKVLVASESVILAIAFALALGLVLGTLDGMLVRYFKISPIIVTLALMGLYSGVAYAVTRGDTVFGFPQSFIDIGQEKWLGVPIPVIVAAVIFAAGGYFLIASKPGMRLYAIGGNEEAARLNGVRVGRMLVALYGINGLLMGVVATLSTARLATGSPGVGQGFELDVLTAVILGGVAFNGGGGHPLGIFFGVATIGVLNAGVIFAGLEDWYQDIVRAGVLLLALASDQLVLRLRARSAARRAAPTEAADDGATYARFERRDRGASRRNGEPPVLSVRGAGKRYGSVVALHDFSLDVHPGEVVCLLGDNGAGKSTAIKLMSGAIAPDGGTITFAGEHVELHNPSEARRLGIETVHQGLALCPNLSIAHNLVLGEEPMRSGLGGALRLRDDREAARRAAARLTTLGIGLERLDESVSGLSGGQRQSVAIARALRDDVELIILDEPTAALGVGPTRRVLEVVRTAAERGAGVILITHDIETVLAVADHVVVLRLGGVICDASIGEVDASSLAHMMAGIEVAAPPAGVGAETSQT